jgi:hypothetical protein
MLNSNQRYNVTVCIGQMPLLFPAHGEVELVPKALAPAFIFYRAGLDLDAKKPTSMVSDDI